MLAEYLLLVQLNLITEMKEQYVGSFINCDSAHAYYEKHFRFKKPFDGYRCLHEDYVHLPDDWQLIKKEIYDE
jgi:hypothetical protein